MFIVEVLFKMFSPILGHMIKVKNSLYKLGEIFILCQIGEKFRIKKPAESRILLMEHK